MPVRMTHNKSKNRLYYLVNNLVEVLFLYASQTTDNITLNVSCYDLALYKTWFGKGMPDNHFVGKRIGVLGIEPVIGSDEDKIEHPVFCFL